METLVKTFIEKQALPPHGESDLNTSQQQGVTFKKFIEIRFFKTSIPVPKSGERLFLLNDMLIEYRKKDSPMFFNISGEIFR
jgi:hypothetical protein